MRCANPLYEVWPRPLNPRCPLRGAAASLALDIHDHPQPLHRLKLTPWEKLIVLLIPAIDFKDGRCVRLRQGRMDDETVFSDDPVEMADRWVAQAPGGCTWWT